MSIVIAFIVGWGIGWPIGRYLCNKYFDLRYKYRKRKWEKFMEKNK